MKQHGFQHRFWKVGLALLLLTSSRAFAAPTLAPKDALPAEYAAMVTQLSLNADQQTALREKVQAMQTGLTGWDQQHREQMNKLRTEFQQADTDTGAKMKIAEQFRLLQEERGKLDASLRKEITNVLTPEQQQTWTGLTEYHKQEFGLLVKVLGLNADQDGKLKAATKDYATGQTKWEQENGDKERQLEQQLREISVALQTLRATKDKLKADETAAVTTQLTADQQIAWIAYKLHQHASQVFFQLKLTAEQQDKLKALCTQTAKDQHQPIIDGNIAGSEASEASVKLIQLIQKTVLTDAQRTAMKSSIR